MEQHDVLQICSYYGSGFYRLLFESLSCLGYRQKVFYFAPKGTKEPKESEDVVFAPCYSQLERLAFRHKEAIVIKSLESSGLLRTGYDLIHAHSLFSNGYVAFELNRRFGIPYLVAVRNTDVNVFLKRRPHLRNLGMKILGNAHKIVFLSEAYRKEVIGGYVAADLRDAFLEKSHVIPNGINPLFHQNTPKLNLKTSNAIKVIQVGDINRNKNQLTVAKACEQLVSEGIPVRFTVIGEIRDSRVAKSLQKREFVSVKPRLSQDELLREYRDADVFAMPSRRETFGISYVEAMSQGLPVIYTKGQGFDGRYPDGLIGYAVDSADSEEIAMRIKTLAERKEAMFGTCIQEARKFDWSEIASEYDQLYVAAING